MINKHCICYSANTKYILHFGDDIYSASINFPWVDFVIYWIDVNHESKVINRFENLRNVKIYKIPDTNENLSKNSFHINYDKNTLRMLIEESYRGSFFYKIIYFIIYKLKIVNKILINKTFFYKKNTLSYYALVRYLNLPFLLKKYSDILILDIDSRIIGNLSDIFNAEDSVYIWKRSGAWSKSLAGFFFVKNSHVYRDVLFSISDLINEHVNAHKIYWGLDQVILDFIDQVYSCKSASSGWVGLGDSNNVVVRMPKGDSKWL